MRLPDDPDPPSQINIVPMIDVIFAILTFFIMSTLFLTRSEGLPVNLPSATTSETQEQAQLVVTLTAAGELALDRQPITLEGLETQVRAKLASGETPVVVINADTAVSHGKVVEVMDRLRLIDGIQLAIATHSP